MRILHIISTLDPAAGGPAEGVRLLMGYKQEGYSGEVVTFDKPDAPYLQNLPFKVHALGPQRWVYGYTPRLYPWLRRHRDHFDGFVVNGLWQYCGLATMLALHGRKPYMVFTHGMLDPYFKHAFPWKHIKKILYWYPIEFWVLRNAFRVLFTTETERRLAESSFALHHWRAAVVPYGVSGPTAPAQDDLETFYNTIPAVRDKTFLLFLGRIHRKKGCDLLIRAFCEVAQTNPDLHLVMAGPDQTNWGPALRATAQKAGVAHRIHWPGILRDGAKWGAFRAADAFILPSHQENFGIAVAESLACSTPVLLSDQVNVASQISAEQCGYVEPDTLDGTRRLISRWLATTPAERADMRKRSEISFRKNFDMRQNAYAIIRLFDNAIQT